ncbi:unnamed protein product [Withania somnifera]
MASAQLNAGESHGQAQANTEQWIDSAKNKANSAVDQAENAAQRASESGQPNKDQNSGFLRQKGEQMMHVAQGAIDGVKNTLGIGSEKK